MLRAFIAFLVLSCLSLTAFAQGLLGQQDPQRLDLTYAVTVGSRMNIKWASLHDLGDFSAPLSYDVKWDYGFSKNLKFFAEQNGTHDKWLGSRSLGLSYQVSSANTSVQFNLLDNIRVNSTLPTQGLQLKLDVKTKF